MTTFFEMAVYLDSRSCYTRGIGFEHVFSLLLFFFLRISVFALQYVLFSCFGCVQKLAIWARLLESVLNLTNG